MAPRRRLRAAAAGVGAARLVALVCLVAALAAGQRAAAHAQLVAAEPPAGAVVAEMPTSVVLRFNEPVAPLVVRWFPPGGEPVEVAATADGLTITVPAAAGLGNGTHLVSWRVVSGDGHPIGGSHAFSVGAPSATGEVAGTGATAGRVAVARGLLTLALVVGAGGAVFARLVDRDGLVPARTLRAARVAALLAPALAFAALGLHGLDLHDAPLAALAGRGSWIAALGSPFARTCIVAGFAGLLAAAALDRRGRAAAGYALAAWVAAAISFALSGHAATAAPVVLTAPSVAVHAAAFIFWLGALPGIVALAAGSGPGSVPLLRRFARLASPLVAGLVLSGAVLAVVQLGGPALRLDTAYGRLLAAKLVAVVGLLALAAINRWRLVPAIAAGKAGASTAFRRSVLAEIALGLVIVALASGFRLTPPPRALQDAPAEQYVHLHGAQVMADVVLRPGRPGANDLEIVVMDAGFAPMQPLEVSVAFSDPARGIERIATEAVRDGEVWRAGPVHLPVGGAWTLRLDVLVSDFEKAALEGEIRLGD